MVRIVRDASSAFMLISLVSAWGCGSGSSAPTAGPDVFQHAALQEVGDLYRIVVQASNKPPAKVGDFARYEIGLPSGYQEVKNGNIVVKWGTTLSDTAASSVLAYEKAVPQAGGYVLMQDGMTIKKMTPEEFKAADTPAAKK